MNMINMDSRLGNCAFSIGVLPIAESMEKLAKLGLEQLVFHKIGSAIYPAETKKTKPEFNRDSVFSPALAAFAEKQFRKFLGDYFEIKNLEFKAYEKTDSKSAIAIETLEKLGMHEAAEALRQKLAEEKAKAASATESPAAPESLG